MTQLGELRMVTTSRVFIFCLLIDSNLYTSFKEFQNVVIPHQQNEINKFWDYEVLILG